MDRTWIPWLLLMCSAMSADIGIAADADSLPGRGVGWTGATNPKAVIAARQELMYRIEALMKPIDTITVEPVKDTELLHSNAETIHTMLLAFPHLFPPTTSRYDPKVKLPETLALPIIWQDFTSFSTLAAAAAKAAGSMAAAQGTGPLRTASRQLRASCDACHELFVRKYVEPKVQDSDRQFDFDKVLGGKVDSK